MKQAIEITDIAKSNAAKMIAARGKPSVGIRVGVRTRGCSGLSYTIEYADDIKPFEEVVNVEDENSGSGGFKILIDPKAVMFLLGTTMDYKEDKFKSGFEFINPNEKGRCGCGESFTV
jgi:iron-sulfur cluster assembly protein